MNKIADGDHEFVGNFIQYFDGEKDPRNLMIVFSILQVPMSEWDLGPHVQELFDTVFNYFPITFKPPPGDPYGITAQDLKDRLRDCIAATAEFAPYSFPALLDKLDSSSMNTKRDVLASLLACAEKYAPQTISLYSLTLWDALKFEVLNSEEEDLAEDSLKVLSTIAHQLPMASEGALTHYLKPVIKECNEHFEDAPTKQSAAAGRILYAVAKESPNIADTVVKGVLPNLFTLFKNSESISKRRGLIEVLNKIVAAVEKVSSQWLIKDEDGVIIRDRATSSAIRDFSSESLEVLLRAAMNAPQGEVSFRLYSLQGLAGLIRIRQLLNDSEAGRIVDTCTEIVIREPSQGYDEVKEKAIQTLIEASHHFPGVTGDKAIPAFIAELPDCPEEGIFTYEPALEAFAKLGTEVQIVDTIIVRLKNKVNAALHQGAPRSYILALLTALLYIFTHGSPSQDEGLPRMSYFWDLAKPLLEQAIGLGTSEAKLLSSEACVTILARICNIIVRPQSGHVQNQVYASFERLFESLHADQPTPEADATGRTGSKLGVIASLHLHAAFQRDLIGPEATVKTMKAISDVALGADETPGVRLDALKHITLLVNKFVSSANLAQTLQDVGLDQQALLNNPSPSSTAAVHVAHAITKGLIIQGKSPKIATAYLQGLLELLGDLDNGPASARGFASLLAPDDTLAKENHCIISGLYKQKVYSQIYTAIANAVKVADSVAKQNYLAALSGILRWLPYSLIQPSLPTITPLLLQSLDTGDQTYHGLKAATLITVESVLMHDPSAVSGHAASLITRLLNGTSAPSNLPEVRTGSLKCLKLLPTQLKRETVMPYRKEVVKRLLACLDDKKRVVRAEAVRCRSNWLGLDSGDVEDEE